VRGRERRFYAFKSRLSHHNESLVYQGFQAFYEAEKWPFTTNFTTISPKQAKTPRRIARQRGCFFMSERAGYPVLRACSIKRCILSALS